MAKIISKRIPSFNLNELLFAMAIVGIMIMLALPYLMPLISKTKSLEAQTQLKFIYNLQSQHFYLNSKYSPDLNDLDFEPPKTVNENGTSNYVYEIVDAGLSSFKVRATAITDFDRDGVLNVWEIDENGNPIQITKD